MAFSTWTLAQYKMPSEPLIWNEKGCVCWLTNTDVLDNMDGALESIYLALRQRSAPSPGAVHRPLPKGRGYGVPRGKADKNK